MNSIFDETNEINNNNNKICRVCGDKALGYNFNALTCESCKAFFRRNALRNKKFVCISGTNECKLDPKTRKYCRKCRLGRCFEIGMIKEWILTDEDKLKKRKKHRQIETKDADSSTSTSNSNKLLLTNSSITNNNNNKSMGYVSKSFISETATVPEKITNNIIILPIYPENSHNNSSEINSKTIDEFYKKLDLKRLIEIINEKLNFKLSTSSSSNTIIDNQIIFYNDINNNSHPNNLDQQQLKSKTLERESSSIPINNNNNNKSNYYCDIEDPHKIPQDIYENALRIESMTEHLRSKYSKQLNHIEMQRLEELRRIFQPLYTAEMEEGFDDNNNDVNDNPIKYRQFLTGVEEGLQFLENTIKELIIVVKNIRAFKNLCEHDQLSLMKGSIGKVRGLLNVRYFNPTQDTMAIPNPQQKNTLLVIKQEYLRKSYGDHLYDRCKKFALSFQDEWKKDDTIMNLLLVIMMFWPNRPDLLHPQYIKLEYLSYCHLLQRYLEIKYKSICEAKSVYLILLSLLKQLNQFTEECIELILMKFDPKYIGKLTFAVYDLDKKFKQNS